MCAAVAPLLITTLSAEAIRVILAKHGPDIAQWALSMYVQWQSGSAATQQRHTMEEIQRFTANLPNLIERKEIRVVPGAFNSTPNFINYFQVAALGAIPLSILEVGQAIRRVGASLESIRSELAIANVSNVQGWGEGGFGSYIHRFVQNEMLAFDDSGVDQDEKHHYFYVWHPDNDWHTAFEERQAEQPLGPSFGGYHYDLPTLCLRMRADREVMNRTTEYGRTAVFHLVIPAYQPLVVDTKFRFAKELFLLIITGARHRGTDLVWLALCQDAEPEMPELQFVSILPDAMGTGDLFMMGHMSGWAGLAACGVAAIVFPPCAPAAGVVADCVVAPSMMASFMAGFTSGLYEDITRPEVQVLGDAVFFDDFGLLG
ncbi:hypothetical protein FPOA_03398 [Fusarium poae]|uniref:Uncharacterized protein n=1 Tax=Fusarium poae TaxID=36050 RepID=A0A1B8B9Q9_FUSPO|nr:hypothetical protein FPOA_03398 [Fusarium poae]